MRELFKMANKLIVDGYNVIGRSPALRQDKAISLERARMALAKAVSAWNRDHSSYRCVIVFDGRDPVGVNMSKATIGGVSCVFTRTKIDADDEIIRMVRDEKTADSVVTVVSDDNYVGNNCRAHGATVQPASYLDVREDRKAGRSGQKGSPIEKAIDHKTISEINREQRERFGL